MSLSDLVSDFIQTCYDLEIVIVFDWIEWTEGDNMIQNNKKIEKWFPPFKEQTRIAAILSNMNTEIQALETKLQKYRNVKLGMIQNLLKGKIRLI